MKKKVFIAVSVILLLVMTSILFVACTKDKDGDTPTFDTIKAIFEKNGYYVDEEELSAGTTESTGMERVLYFGKNNYDVGGTVTWFTSAERAKSVYEDMLEDLEDELSSGEAKVIIRGKMIACGTAESIDLIP